MLTFREVRSMNDRKVALALYQGAPAYFRTIGDPYPSRATIEHDRTVVPTGITTDHKHFNIIMDGQDSLGVLDYVTGYPDASSVYLGLLLLPTKWQRQGYGRRVVQQLRKQLLTATYTRLQIAVVQTDVDAINFWHAVGFRDIAVGKTPLGPSNVQTVVVMGAAIGEKASS